MKVRSYFKRDILIKTGIADYRTLDRLLRNQTELWERLKNANYPQTKNGCHTLPMSAVVVLKEAGML